MSPIAVNPPSETIETLSNSLHKTSNQTPPPALTLDYSQWTGESSTESTKKAFIQQLRKASAGLGFFYLLNTPLDQGDLRKRIFTLNQAFFDLPLDVRQKISIVHSPHFRGFSKFGDERTQDKVDHRDQIDYGLEFSHPIQDENLLKTFPFLHLIGPNQFLPDSILPGHRDLVLKWLDISQSIAHQLTKALEVALGASETSLLHYLTGGQTSNDQDSPAMLYARMKTIRYPRAKSIDGVERLPESTQGVGAHKDGGWITILATSPHRGLQVQSLNGEWLDVHHHPNAMVINFGQQIERVSRGAINAATHRVLSHTSQEDSSPNAVSATQGDRFSVAYFSMPALNVVVKPLPPNSLSSEILQVWQEAQQERQKAGLKDVISSVPSGDLWGQDDEPFGFQAWKGIVRSHPNVVERFKYSA